MKVIYTNWLGREQEASVEDYIFQHLTDHNSGGELEEMRRQIDRNTEMLAKIAALAVKTEEDLRSLVYVPHDAEVVK